MPVGRGGGHGGHIALSPVPLASRDQDGGPSDTTIDIHDLTEK